MKVELIKFIDKYFGSLVCLILSINKIFPTKEKTICKKILLIQFWGIGETILALPAIKALRDKNKKSRIDILVTDRVKEIFYYNKNINNVKVLRLNPISILIFILKSCKKYDLVIDMEEYLNISSIIAFFAGKERVGYRHGIRSSLYTKKVDYNDKQHTSETFLDLVRVLNINHNLKSLEKLDYSKKDKNTVDKFLKNKKMTKKDFVVGIAPGAAESAKSRIWPLENYVELCNSILKNKKSKIIFIGNKNENELIKRIQSKIEEKNRTINTAGLFDLNSLFYLIEKCNLFISNDAGAMHIAAAQGIKTIGLFGPNLPVRFAPYGKNNIAIYKGDNCAFSPCINVHKGQVPDCYYPKNSKDYQKCMKNIEVRDVLKVIK
ncbi:glycosyl transferase [Candidatus Woesearchaeota archaeon]|nr:glycosyl transferase [Candidatus Woesearchaeota archaeon]|tara:strand:- start:3339 stop:4472 length:1134 start_codon:yes stop_codon:yes gene_type:complete